jgi:DNA-binding transcriptional MerR regulator
VTDAELMTIGRFSRISGLSVHTLRHYDDVGLLAPAEVDPANGYRRYRRDQLRQARVIQALRWIDPDIDHYLEKGLSMTPASTTRPVQLKIAVDDIDEAITFYQKAFGFHYDITRRTDEGDYSSFMFGKYGEGDFFLLHLLDEQAVDCPGPTTFGLLVDDLDATHRNALAAGAADVVAPHDSQGMPRNAAVKDPSGNWIWLYQG